MSKLELNQIYLELEHEINHLSQTTVISHCDAVRKDAQQVISEFKKDIDRWVVQLNERSIACYELESLLESKKDQMKLQRLKDIGVDMAEIEIMKSDILRLIARSIMNTYLNSLFRTQRRSTNKIVKNQNIF